MAISKIKSPKTKSAYVCGECGASYGQWQGQCGDCGAWNSLSELALSAPNAKPQRAGYAGASAAQITALKNVSDDRQIRLHTGLNELDRVLGGGLVEGSVVLIGGDPGIGKSTLLLQALASMAVQVPSLYISGEESLGQIAGRAKRLDLSTEHLLALAETSVEKIIAHCEIAKPKLLVADSIQTLWSEQLSAAPGSVSQVRECAARLVRYAKETGTSVFLVGHVTKEGGIAGPRVLEHMVDAVLYFEGESGSRFRILRAFKNRFGAVNELGVFAMADKGLKEVANPSAIFIWAKPKRAGQRGVGHPRRHAPVVGGSTGLGRSIGYAQSAPRYAWFRPKPFSDVAGRYASSRRRGRVRPRRVRECSGRHSRARNCR
jgi:DNA repair protein RadA/Sms